MKCDCAFAALSVGYIIQGATYDEKNHEFTTTEDFYMPLSVRDERGRSKPIKLTIKCCPICGMTLW